MRRVWDYCRLTSIVALCALLQCPLLADGRALAGAEELRIRVVDSAGGEIAASRDGGASWLRIGSVTSPLGRVSRDGFSASRFAADSAVCATAVNAIHIKVCNDPATGKGVVFSLVPAGKLVGAALRDTKSVIDTDIPAGAGIFGGGLGPRVNSPVFVERDGELSPLAPGWQPAPGDVIVIIRYAPPTALRYIEFENKFGGRITVEYLSGERVVIGQVLRPVWGVGRFPGTEPVASGRIRANHPGVIDVSTSPFGAPGGFQIIPAEHANDPEMDYVAGALQWMVVGPLSVNDPRWEGAQPLFSGYLLPSWRADDITGDHPDWVRRVLSRCLVLARVKGNDEWGPLPRVAFSPTARANMKQPPLGEVWWLRSSLNPSTPLPPEANSALRDVTALRIEMPLETFWP